MGAAMQDPTRPVREGEELDVPWLERYLSEHVDGFAGPLTVEQFPAGHSNLTYLLSTPGREYVLRRPPFGAKAIKAGHDMGREFRVLSGLRPVFGRVPEPLVFCPEESSPMQAAFYVMERVPGIILRRTRPPAGIELTQERMRRLSEDFVDNLVELHAVDWRQAGLANLGRPEGYLGRQVSGWTERYAKARTDEIPEMEVTARWLAANLLPASGATIIHNDYKYDNLVLDPGDLSLRAVLDWEMATVGDPLSDLGMALAYWVEEGDPDEAKMLPVGPTMLPGNLTRAGLVARYAERSGRDVSNIVFHYVLGLFKVAVIAQQIYSRYKQGLTKDERFAMLIFAVQLLARLAQGAIERGEVTPST